MSGRRIAHPSERRPECVGVPECRVPRRGSAGTRMACLAIAFVVISAGTAWRRVDAATCLRPPVDGPIARPFDAPPCPWCAGHRGITYRVSPGTRVGAAAAGTVTFSGIVVEVRYIVVRHGDGLLATYGGLEATTLSTGDRVAAGAMVGTSGAELYFGLRTGPDAYIDPAPLIGTLDVPPYLVPTDGTPSRPPPDPVLRCASS